ncbi:UDP-2,4-diacetamido-2,4,6-trideoxy-beta-L-altropyranose hydrolase [Salidesulfovibrio onnuriiensis]|uniref:UDP-2,4-diacetamido-2,4, 6-trideoxy-beta-L-altropyranose hydrolase n=1 Tax=Salidesulfovibrio onnuriiensis TaxID=2583823 RepID=UPI0011C916DC|nr:UDP-2,4-diacetamido-2,4,6-trideoxy-beta-L-altropyranose hydrolase [Salidesulfovibrio onnuriiensis]
MTHNQPGQLHIRADATPAMGGGHVMRCLALAQAWKRRGGEVAFHGHLASEAIRTRIENSGFTLVPINADSTGAAPFVERDMPEEWVVLDGYHFTPNDGIALRQMGYRTLFIDDQAQHQSYPFDLVLNHNVHASNGMYPEGTTCLTGPRHALIREEFLDWNNKPRTAQRACPVVFITMGASDPTGTTFTALKALSNASFEAVVVSGPANPRFTELAEACRKAPFPAKLLDNPANLAEEMWRADLAITSASVVSLELACLGVPMLAVTTADNQTGVGRFIERSGVGVDCGGLDSGLKKRLFQELLRLKQNPETLKEMAAAGRRLVDGHGAARVVERMAPTKISVRPAEETDCAPIWQWANDPVSRTNSFDSSEIPWESHCKWFTAKLEQKDCRMLIGMNQNNVPVGVVRVEFVKGEHVISVNLSPQFRGVGLGSALIKAGCEHCCRDGRMAITAYVKPENAASRKVFAAAGFLEQETLDYTGAQALRMIFRGE